MVGKMSTTFFWKQKQITQNFNNQQLIDVGLNLSDYKFLQEHKGKYEKRLLFLELLGIRPGPTKHLSFLILILCDTKIDLINVGHWPIFHCPVLLLHILKIVSCMNIILWDNESVWCDDWPYNRYRSQWPLIFHGQVIWVSLILCTQKNSFIASSKAQYRQAMFCNSCHL